MNDPKAQFIRELPRRGGGTGKWMVALAPLVKKPGQWALIQTCETPVHANKLQSNLHARQAKIPEPNHVWQFAARGCEVYAIYRGRKRGSDASIRRANRGG
jgi:hypothetical protein